MASVHVLVSIKRTIESLIDSPHVSIISVPCPGIDFLYEELLYLKTFLLDKNKRTPRLYALQRQIGELARQFEDVFDSHVSNQFLTQSSQSAGDEILLLFTLDFEQLIPDVISFIETSKEMVNQYIKDVCSRTCPIDVIDLQSSIERLRDSSQVSLFPPCPKIRFLYDELDSLSDYFDDRDIESIIESESALLLQIGESVQKIARSILNLFPSQSHQSSSPPGDHPLTFYSDLQEFLQRIYILENNRVEQTKKATLRLQDVLKEFFRKYETLPSKFTLDTPDLNQEIDSFTTRVKEIKEEHPSKSTNRLNLLITKMRKFKDMYYAEQQHQLMMAPFGLHDQFIQLRSWLVNDTASLQSASIVGMAGIGKTTLARQVYEDPLILDHFDERAWVILGQEYDDDKWMMHILVQLNPEIDLNDVTFEENIYAQVISILMHRRYLIVFDDVYEKFQDFKVSQLFPNEHNGSRILVTTRLNKVAVKNSDGDLYKMPFLNKEDSWRLLRRSSFENELCPPELVKYGEKIAENCEGLPLLIIAVGNHLSKSLKTLEYWNHMTENGNTIVINADDELSKVLVSSYDHLDSYLKPCFLYIGVFPHNYKMQTSKLIDLWCVEGVLELSKFKISKAFAKICLVELESRNLILVTQKNYIDDIKTCKLHCAYWHICVREAWKEKFFHVLNSYADSFKDKMQNQRRLCVHNNVLFAIKDVYNSIATISTTARSLLCTGPPLQYPVPMCFGLELLRVLDALNIHFYSFPAEVLKLLRLTYLSFKYNGKLPGSISKLWNLEYLIVHQNLSIISYGSRSYMPMELWNMTKLKHLQVMGRDLPDPCGRFLPNLLTLLDVGYHSCTKEVFEGIPHLKKLGIRIELSLDVVETVCYFDHLVHLDELESLKCVVVNPNNRSPIVSPPPSNSCFPRWLKKLSLSGFGYPWKYMNTIAKLENLQVLKLRDYAFRGSRWEANEGDFPGLGYLLIEDTDLEYWGGDVHMPWTIHLTIRNCYKLKELPLAFGDVPYLRMIELVDCNPLAVASVKKIQEVQQSHGNNFLKVSVHFSADDGKTKA